MAETYRRYCLVSRRILRQAHEGEDKEVEKEDKVPGMGINVNSIQKITDY